jgi:hypothetical protein
MWTVLQCDKFSHIFCNLVVNVHIPCIISEVSINLVYRMFLKYTELLLGLVLCTKTTNDACVSMGP